MNKPNIAALEVALEDAVPTGTHKTTHADRERDQQWNARQDRLDAIREKMAQHSRDVAHTLKLDALVAKRAAADAKLLRCGECDAVEGTVHFGFCSYFGDGSGEVVT